MADDPTDAAGPGRPKRPPPTIDLAPTQVTTAAAATDEGRPWDHAKPADDTASEAPPPPENETIADDVAASEPPPRQPRGFLPLSAVAALSGATMGALVVAAFWLLGPSATPPAPTPQISASAFDALAARVAGIESKPPPTAPAPASDPRAAARIDAQEKVIAGLREELGVLRAQAQQLTATAEALKAAPREGAPAPPPVDLSPVNARLDQIEQTAKKLSAETAQRNAQPASDLPLRRIVAASLLDNSVRQGEPYAALLEAAKPLVADPAVLKPLDAFAATGVPSVNVLGRELVAQISRLSPTPTPSGTTGEAGLLDRLQAGAAKLVRIQRTDEASGADRGSVIARATSAAVRNDIAAARRDLETLPAADRAALQPWIAKADARAAALAASRQFAADAMASLAKPTQ